MKKLTVVLMLLIAAGNPVWAAAPDLLPPLSMQVDPGDGVLARGLDFLHAPLSGAVNFTPQNYDVHLPGGVILQVEDVVPYFGIQQPVKDCQGVATVATEVIMPMFDILLQYVFPKVMGVDPKAIEPDLDKLDPKKMYNATLDKCNNDPKAVDLLLAQGKLAKQIVADVRNSKVGATDVTFSGQLLDPYTDFPLATPGYGGAVIGGTTANGTDVWSDGIVVASYEPQFPNLFGFPLMSSSLNLYRFVPNTASKKVLKWVGISTGWLDKPVMTNGKITNSCFKDNPGDPKNPVIMKDSKELLDAGCVGENLAVAVATPNFYGHPGDKLKDIVVVSRAPFGLASDPAAKLGYITLYKRNEALPAPSDTSLFQDIWKFDRSYTNATFGIPEPYGAAVVKNWDPTKNTEYDGVVAGSNKLQGSRYYVYYFVNGMTEPKAIQVGGTAQGLPGEGGFGPYRVYSADVNGDRCGDILLTRARISVDGKKIEFPDYFDVHLQDKLATGECRQTFEMKGRKYPVSIVNPQFPPQISALAVADFNKDGRNDVMAADFTTYLNKTTGIRENFAHFLEYKGGVFNIVDTPRYVVTTKNHGDDVGPVDIKADAHANLGVVIGKPMVFAGTIPNPCAKDPVTGKVDPNLIDPTTCNLCRPGADLDKDGFNDFPGSNSVKVKTCIDGKMVEKEMFLNPNENFTYSPDCIVSATKTGRQWMHEWAGCDNCGGTDTCNGPEDGDNTKDKCWNLSQADDNFDGYGNICSAGNPPAAGQPGAANPAPVAGNCADGTPYNDVWLNANEKVVLDAQGNVSSVDAGIGNDKDNNNVPDCKVIFIKGISVKDCKNNCQADNPQKAASLKPLREDKVMYADEQPVIAHKEELKEVFNLIEIKNDVGPEVTVLLNKTPVKDTKKQCTNGDLACICDKNPDLLACKCLKDPQAPECKTEPTAQPTCAVDVCRGDLTAPFPRMCDTIRPYNDEIRKCTGLNSDFLIPVEGAQYHVSCTMPNTPALDLGNGMAYTRIYKTGQPPKNYFKDWHKPVAEVLAKPVLLNPADKAPDGTDLDLSPLPNPGFDADPLLSVVPNATLNQAPGITQIDGIMEIQTNLVDMSGVAGAGKAVGAAKQTVGFGAGLAPAGAVSPKILSLDIKAFSSPPGCQWAGPDCPKPMPNPPSPQEFVNAICAAAKAAEAAGKPVTIDTVNEAFNAMNVGPGFLHQKFVIPGVNTQTVLPVQYAMPTQSAEGGCGCTITATSTVHNTLLPLLMAASALGGMLFFRRNTAKKR